MPKILIRMPDMAFMASAHVFVFQRVGVLYTEDVLYIFRSFEYLLAGVTFGLFYAGQG